MMFRWQIRIDNSSFNKLLAWADCIYEFSDVLKGSINKVVTVQLLSLHELIWSCSIHFWSSVFNYFCIFQLLLFQTYNCCPTTLLRNNRRFSWQIHIETMVLVNGFCFAFSLKKNYFHYIETDFQDYCLIINTVTIRY